MATILNHLFLFFLSKAPFVFLCVHLVLFHCDLPKWWLATTKQAIILGCLEISTWRNCPFFLFNLVDENYYNKHRKKPRSLPKYHKNGGSPECSELCSPTSITNQENVSQSWLWSNIIATFSQLKFFLPRFSCLCQVYKKLTSKISSLLCPS